MPPHTEKNGSFFLLKKNYMICQYMYEGRHYERFGTNIVSEKTADK